jgi:hypothetical protein
MAWLERLARDKKSILFCPCISYDTFYNICPCILTKNTKVVGVTYVEAGNPYWRGMISTIGLLVKTSLDQFLLIMQTLFTFTQNRLS